MSIYILNLETTTTNCSVSLSKDGQVVALKEDNSAGYSHAERLHLYIDTVLKQSKVATRSLHAVAVSKGPGSYTGLRIGVSAAKGICFALDIPLIGVSTLQSLAHQVSVSSGCIIPLLDARRQEVYSAIFCSDYNEIRSTQAQVLDTDSFQEYLSKGLVYFVGNGVEKTKALITHPNAVFIENHLPSAKTMANLAWTEYKIGNTESVAYFEPYYLKDFIALKPKSKTKL